MLEFKVKNNTVMKSNPDTPDNYTIPRFSVNAIEIKFYLDRSWDEYSLRLQVTKDTTTYNVLLENNKAYVPADIETGEWNVSIIGEKGTEKRNTTIPATFKVVDGGYVEGGSPAVPPEPDLYQQLIEKIEEGNDIAQSVRDDADAGLFNGKDGTGIEKIELLNKSGKTATYKITFTDGSSFEYQVLDGQDGINGVNGITPTIGENGNWFIGEIDTGKPARGEKGEQGEQGIQGIQGVPGQDGTDGVTPDISINATVNNTVGTPSVSIEKTGTLENPVFNLSFENLKGEQGLKGDKGEQGVAGTNGADGKTATITIGTVTTVSPDTPASVTNTGTETDAIFNFEIPKGADGSGGGGADLETIEKIAIKTTIEGNPAISNSSADWRIPLIEGYGKSTQEADPAPESPQEIKSSVVTGVKLTGANIIDCTQANERVLEKGNNFLKFSLWGYTIFDTGYVIKIVKPNTKYYYSCTIMMNEVVQGKKTFDLSKRLMFFSDGGNLIIFESRDTMTNGQKIKLSGSFTTKENLNNVRIGAYSERYTNEDGTGQYLSTITVEDFMISENPIAEYEPYKEKTIPLSTPIALRGIHSETGNITIDGTKYLSDVIDKEKVTRYIGYIASYNGEDVGDLWMSTTGQLNTGATVIYALSEPITEPLPPEDVQALKELKTFYPSSVISWETEDNSGAWTRAEIIHDPKNYIDEQISSAVTQSITLAQGGTA